MFYIFVVFVVFCVCSAAKNNDKATSINTRNDNGVVTELYLSQKRERKISIKTWVNMVYKPKDGFESWLCERKVLAPLASVVLNGNHLGGRFICSHRFRLSAYVLVSYFYIIKTKRFFLFGVIDEMLRSHSYVFPCATGNSKLRSSL